MRLLKVEWDPRLFPFFPFPLPFSLFSFLFSLFSFPFFPLLASVHDVFLPLYITGVV